jgi:outer membrane protein
MKKHFTIAAVAVMMAAAITGCQSNGSQSSEVVRTVALSDTMKLPIAYINVDSLLLNYNYAKDMNEEFVKKAEDARSRVNAQMQRFQKDYNDFQRKLQTNAFLSEDRAKQEASRLQDRQVEIEKLQEQLQQELNVQQAQMNMRLNDTVRTYLREMNEVKKYELILSNTMYDNILIDFPKYDITGEVIEALNARYAKNQAAK